MRHRCCCCQRDDRTGGQRALVLHLHEMRLPTFPVNIALAIIRFDDDRKRNIGAPDDWSLDIRRRLKAAQRKAPPAKGLQAGQGGMAAQVCTSREPIDRYFNEVLIDVNTVFRLVPRPLTTAIIASAIPAAIRPYSMAVAPHSSARNFPIVRFKFTSTA